MRTEPGKARQQHGRRKSRYASAIRTASWASFARVQNFKKSSYASDSFMAVTLRVTGLVLAFSALGIFGLATFNVNRRTRQIGTRRAVGARRRDIVSYFLAENWIVTTLGVLLGAGLALAAGFWLSNEFRLPRFDLYFPRGRGARPLGARAAGGLAAGTAGGQVSPAMATRSV